MSFIHLRMNIPVPQIHAFNFNTSNKIGFPHILMSFIPGFRVCDKWFVRTESTTLKERRRGVLDTAAEAISQWQNFEFDKIGIFTVSWRHNVNEVDPNSALLYVRRW
jgi:hypothetical protein